jgi:phage terminase large subunit GpA-like protein
MYGRIEGDVMNTDDGAWLALDDMKQAGDLIFRRSDGREFGVMLCFIDSGDGNTRDIVYDFCRTWDNCYPIKGFNILKRRRGEKDDEETPQDSLRYRPKKLDEDLVMYEISTNFYKKSLYRSLKIARNETGPQKAGFQDFPIDRDENYFKMLTAEEMKSDGSFYCPGGRRNEALDVRVYGMCAGAVYLNSLVTDMRLTMKEYAKEAGEKAPSIIDIQNINHRFVLNWLKEQTARQSPT